jgi:hypothetical protein
LATLASLQQTDNTVAQDQQHAYDPQQNYGGYQDTAQIFPTQQTLPYHQSADPRLLSRQATQPFPPAPRPQDRTSTPLIDPATIIEWKQGLRCVSKIASQNPEFAASVRKVLLRASMCRAFCKLTAWTVDERARRQCQAMVSQACARHHFHSHFVGKLVARVSSMTTKSSERTRRHTELLCKLFFVIIL